ncbi:MAG: winged helix-turn-helix domain-containing protein [Labilithrix sp.]|nr:winged helix-turn-helix domain-containing protein [Labilithrix sp.]MBX3225249.1 winged helix-turn-helix domain-containing protein [Labilithrix sp.]
MSNPGQPASSPGEAVLVVDDEEDIRRLVSFNLDEAGFRVETVDTGAGALAAAARLKPAVFVLDLMLPDLSGTEVCRRLRADAELADAAILMLTARGDEYDRVLGFEVGADDYVVKPFSVRELVMRVKGLAVRARERRLARGSSDEGKRLRWRGLELDPVRHRVTVDGGELGLRPLEYKLLAIFIEHPGRVYSRTELLQEVWGISPDTNTRTVDTHIRRLRERLDAYSEAIETVHGFGYRLRDPS